MNEIHFEIKDDAVIKYTPMPEIGEDIYTTEVVMTKDIFQECYKKWIEPQESKVKQMTIEKEALTVSKFIDILKNLPGDSPIVIVKDDSDDRHDGCYHVMEVAMLHSDYEEKKDAVGLSISSNSIELLSSNYNYTLYTAYRDTEV